MVDEEKLLTSYGIIIDRWQRSHPCSMFSKDDSRKGRCFRLRIEGPGTDGDESERGKTWV